MVTVRRARWPEDAAVLETLDASVTSECVYDVAREELGFRLVERRLDRPLNTAFGPLAELLEEARSMGCALVAEREGIPVGLAAAEHTAWNGRVLVRHLYVDARHRGCGAGRALLGAVEAFAREAGARCLWLETQNLNWPAIQFYQRVGFRFCGLDDSLYDPAAVMPGEVALFFTRDIFT
jgi:GNAT superfamily N-acetyltransferase